MRKLKQKKVIVAMSGGIDSSVAAALLKRAGFQVVGAFMKFWMAPDDNGLIGRWNRCCSPEAEKRARKVAKNLKIPFYVFNFEKEFKKRIVDYFLSEYKLGRTPNPCVVCNKEIKFGLLLEKALKLDADYVATGHYARIEKAKNKKQKIEFKLLKGKDKEKDQSYFLWQLNQKQLKHILFPVGQYTKKEVRELARSFKLPVLKTSESQEICFIKTTINDFLKRHLKPKTGKIVDTKGKILGQHQGLAFYTIGQRKGIGLAGGPYYVLDKDLKKNLLIITKNEKDLSKRELICKNVNWIASQKPNLPITVTAKIRYRHKGATANIFYDKKFRVYRLKFKVAQRAITPGQSVVFYRGEERGAREAGGRGGGVVVLGGGIIY
jgi:tRNA-specific 2-thiouridylase